MTGRRRRGPRGSFAEERQARTSQPEDRWTSRLAAMPRRRSSARRASRARFARTHVDARGDLPPQVTPPPCLFCRTCRRRGMPQHRSCSAPPARRSARRTSSSRRTRTARTYSPNWSGGKRAETQTKSRKRSRRRESCPIVLTPRQSRAWTQAGTTRPDDGVTAARPTTFDAEFRGVLNGAPAPAPVVRPATAAVATKTEARSSSFVNLHLAADGNTDDVAANPAPLPVTARARRRRAWRRRRAKIARRASTCCRDVFEPPIFARRRLR